MSIQANTFLSFLYQFCDWGSLEIRPLPPGGGYFTTLDDMQLRPFPPEKNIFFGVASRNGGGKKEDIEQIPALWLDTDFKNTPERKYLASMKEFPLPPSATVASGGGAHDYWFFKEPLGKEAIPQVEAMLKRLATYFGGDLASTDASRILRVPGSLNFKYDPPREVKILKLEPSLNYELSDFDNILPEMPQDEPPREDSHCHGNERLIQLVSDCAFLGHVRDDAMTLPENEWYTAICLLANQYGGPALIHELSRPYQGYSQKETDAKILHALSDCPGPPLCVKINENWGGCGEGCNVSTPLGLLFKERVEFPTPPPKTEAKWPAPLAEEAYYGLAGEFLRIVDPATEADAPALLLQFLAAFGNAIGRSAYFIAEADKHHSNLFLTIVGETSKGRKGSSHGRVIVPMKELDFSWIDRVTGGLSSGEGLIWQIRDAVYRKEKDKKTGQIKEILVVEAVTDKRLYLVEAEFASVLSNCTRDQNTLSAIIRKGWDGGTLRSLTKNSPAKATGAHVSIVGHITKDELVSNLYRTDSANGFANRFLWVMSRRSKCLPEGGIVDEQAMNSLIIRLKIAFKNVQSGEIKRDTEAREIWKAVYPSLSEGKPGLLGAVTSRAEAQTMRLALIYSLLDQSYIIRKEHLLAGLAVWEYCEASAKYIFGDATGNPDADQILNGLKSAPDGLTRTEIRDLFSRHRNNAQIEDALNFLERKNLARMTKEKTGGKPSEKWRAV